MHREYREALMREVYGEDYAGRPVPDDPLAKDAANFIRRLKASESAARREERKRADVIEYALRAVCRIVCDDVEPESLDEMRRTQSSEPSDLALAIEHVVREMRNEIEIKRDALRDLGGEK